MIIGLDKHYYPIELPVGATIRIGATSIALTAGVYYAHASNTFPATYVSFYAHLCARLITILGGIWTVEAYRPSGYATSSGIRLKVTGLSPGALNLDSTTPLVRRLLGFDVDDTSSVPFVGGALEGPYAAYGAWSPWSCFEGRTSTKDSASGRVMAHSSDAPEDAVRTIWRERKMRLMFYELVYGPYVYGARALVPELADQAGCAEGDKNNALVELWRAASTIARGILVVYDLVDLDLQIPATGWETVIVGTNKALEDLDGLATRSPLAADLWVIRLPYIVTGGVYAL